MLKIHEILSGDAGPKEFKGLAAKHNFLVIGPFKKPSSSADIHSGQVNDSNDFMDANIDCDEFVAPIEDGFNMPY